MQRDRWLYAWTAGSVALGAASLLVPLYYVALGGDAVGLGLLAGIGAAAGAPGALIAGHFADRTGRRRPVVLAAVAVVALLSASMPLVGTAALLILANGVLWFAAGAAAPVLTLLVTVGHDEATWSDRFAALNAYGGWGWAGGLVLGTVWTAVGGTLASPLAVQRSLFLACAVTAALGVVLAARWLPPDDAVIERPDERVLARSVARTRRTGVRSATFPVVPGRLYWLLRSADPRALAGRLPPALTLYLLAVTLAFVGYGAFWGPLPLFLADAGHATGAVFAFYLFSSLGSAACYGAAGRLARDRDPSALHGTAVLGRAILQPGVAVVGLFAGATLAGLLATGAIFVLIGTAWAVVAVTATVIVAGLAPPAVRGQAIGLYTAVSSVANGAGAVLGGWLAARDYLLAAGASGVLLLSSGVVVFALRRWQAGSATDHPEPSLTDVGRRRPGNP